MNWKRHGIRHVYNVHPGQQENNYGHQATLRLVVVGILCSWQSNVCETKIWVEVWDKEWSRTTASVSMFLGDLPMTLRPEMVEYSEDENTLLQKRKKKHKTNYIWLLSSIKCSNTWALGNIQLQIRVKSSAWLVQRNTLNRKYSF